MINRQKYFPSFVIFISALILPISCHKILPEEKVEKSPPALTKGYIRLPQNVSDRYYGFNIYRAEKKEGEFIKVNKELILAPAAGEQKPLFFVDETIIKGKTYYYYVEGITHSGKKERITPVFKVVVQ